MISNDSSTLLIPVIPNYSEISLNVLYKLSLTSLSDILRRFLKIGSTFFSTSYLNFVGVKVHFILIQN
jgi:hypothetical protein